MVEVKSVETTSGPYVGPRPFEERDLLFGRDREVESLANQVVANHVVLLHALSGAGKTSLIQAGLGPYLRWGPNYRDLRRGALPDVAKAAPNAASPSFRVYPIVRVNRLPDPQDVPDGLPANRYQLSTLLSLEADLPSEQQRDLAELATLPLLDYLEARRQDLVGSGPPVAQSPRSLLVFDQFEQILTISSADRDAKEDFFAWLMPVLYDVRYWVVFVIRDDYVGGLEPYLDYCPDRLASRFRLEFLRREDAVVAMREPASRAGAAFDQDALDKLVNDLSLVRVRDAQGTHEEKGDYVEPIQLQVVCSNLWTAPRPNRSAITVSDVETWGNVDNALGRYYDESLARIAQGNLLRERRIREWIDQALLLDGPDGRLRNQVLAGQEREYGLDGEAIDGLTNAYLIRSDQRRGSLWYELAHDRLIGPISRSNDRWISHDLAPLTRDAQLWEIHGRPDELIGLRKWLGFEWWLLGQIGLRALPGMRTTNPDRGLEKSYLSHTRRQASLRGLLAVALVAVVVVVGSLILQTQTRTFEYLERARSTLIATANGALEDPTGQPMLYALYADGIRSDTYSQWLLVQLLIGAWAGGTAQGVSLSGHTGPVSYVGFLDAGRLVTASQDGSAIVWDVARNVPIRRLEQPDREPITAAAVYTDSDRQWLATGGPSGKIRIWDLRDGAMRAEVSGHPRRGDGACQGERGVLSLAFQPGGLWLVSGGDDCVVDLWSIDASTGRPTPSGTLLQTQGSIERLAFSKDGQYLAIGGSDGWVSVGPVAQSQGQGQFLGCSPTACPWVWFPPGQSSSQNTRSGISGLAFDPLNPRRLALAFSKDENNSSLELWDLKGDPTQGQVTESKSGAVGAHGGDVSGLVLCQDGSRAISSGYDGAVKLWSRNSGGGFSPENTFTALVGYPLVVGVDPNCGRIVVGGLDGSVRIVDTTGQPQDFPYRFWDTAHVSGSAGGAQNGIRSLALSPNGKLLATGGRDAQVELWQRDPGDGTLKNPRVLTSAAPNIQAGWVQTLAFNADGTLLASGDRGGSLVLYNTGPGSSYTWSVQSLGTPIYSAVFLPQSGKIAVGTERGLYLVDQAPAPPTPLDENAAYWSVAVTADGAYLAAGNHRGQIVLYERDTSPGAHAPYRQLKVIQAHAGIVYGLAFDHSASLIASAGWDGRMATWKVPSLAPGPDVIRYLGASEVLAVAFSSDDKLLAGVATGFEPGTKAVILQDTVSHRALPPIHTLDHGFLSLVSAPDRNELIFAGFSLKVEVLDLNLDRASLRDRACRLVGGAMTLDEWQRTVGSDVAMPTGVCASQ